MAITIFHKMVFNLLMSIAFVAVWRAFTEKNCVKALLNKLPCPLNPLLQWYSLLVLSFSAVFAWTIGNILINDFGYYEGLDPDILTERLTDLLDETCANGKPCLTQDKLEDYTMPTWLRYLSLSSPIVAILAFCIVAYHLFILILGGYRRKKEEGVNELWQIQGREAMYLLVVAIPLVFLTMAVRSTSRIWMIMTGWSSEEGTYIQDTVTNLALFQENFELASVCQYYLVLVFVFLCISFLYEQKATEEMKSAIAVNGFQGVYFWCLIGTVHSVIVFVHAYLHNFTDLYENAELQAKYEDLEGKIGIVASAFSLAATFNMLMICRLPSINKGLPKASIKFNGTKILLILGPNQLKVLGKAAFLGLSHECTLLLHSSLICIECLVVVVVNFVAWEVVGKSDTVLRDVGYKKMGDA